MYLLWYQIGRRQAEQDCCCNRYEYGNLSWETFPWEFVIIMSIVCSVTYIWATAPMRKLQKEYELHAKTYWK